MSYNNYVTRDELNDAVTDLYNDIGSLKADIDDGAAIGDGAIKACHLADPDREVSFRVEQMDYKQDRVARTLRDSLKSAEHSAGRWQTRAESAEARVEELTEENARLEQELVSAEMGKSPAEQEIKLLTTERAILDDDVRRLHGRVKSLTHNIDHQKDRIRVLTEGRDNLRAENERLTEVLDKRHAEREELLAENDRLRDERDGHAQYGLQMKRRLKHARTAVPRVIRPGEVAPGMRILRLREHWDGLHSTRGVVEAVRGPGPYVTLIGRQESFKLAGDDITILLADAPEDEADDFPCCRIKQTGICEDVG